MTYTVTGNTGVLEAIRNEGRHVIAYKVDGYWSDSQVGVIIRPTSSWEKDGLEINVSYSTGGTDRREDLTDLDRTRNFAAALSDAVEMADYLNTKMDQMNAAYKEYRIKRKAELEETRKLEEARRAKEEAEREAKEAPYKPYMTTKADAEALAEMFYNQLKDIPYYYADADVEIVAPCRMDDFIDGKELHSWNNTKAHAERAGGGKVIYYFNNERVSKVNWIKRMTGRLVLAVSTPELSKAAHTYRVEQERARYEAERAAHA